MASSEILGTRLAVWSERDRLHIHLTARDGETIAEWWDDDAVAFIEDNGIPAGFPFGVDTPQAHAAIVKVCRSAGIIRNAAIVYWVDAIRESEGGWSENDRRTIGTYVNLPETTRGLLRFLRKRGILSATSAGSTMVDDCGTSGEYQWVCDRSNRRPAFAVQWLDSSDMDA